jgi:hypothetical protein
MRASRVKREALGIPPRRARNRFRIGKRPDGPVTPPGVLAATDVEHACGAGEHLPAGSEVLSGGLTASVALRPGANVAAEFDGLGSAEVHC